MVRFVALIFALAIASTGFARAADPVAPAPPVKSASEQADELFDRLAKTTDEEEAAGIVSGLERLRLRSGSDTSDLLMTRALHALGGENYPLALSLLDAIVDLRPEWTEAWNKRATVRYFAGDSRGSMADIAETLKREPRHIGALTGMGAILEEAGRREDALRAYQRGLEIAPHYQPLKEAVDRLKGELAGQAL
jgi:tetratricopeptide (TPR) repeat protein